MSRNNKHFLIGFITGMILPVIFIVVFVHLRYSGAESTLWVLKELFRLKTLSSLLAVGAVPNLLLFFYAMRRENWLMGRGIIAATLFYAVAVMIIKFT